MQLRSSMGIFMHVFVQTVCTFSNYWTVSTAAKHDAFVFVVCDRFLSDYICYYKTNDDF